MDDHKIIRITDDKAFIDTIIRKIDKKQDVLDVLNEYSSECVIFEDICYNLKDFSPIMNVLWKKSDKEVSISIVENKKNDLIVEDEVYINKLNIYYLFPQYLDFLQKKYKIYFNLEIICEKEKKIYQLKRGNEQCHYEFNLENDTVDIEEVLKELGLVINKCNSLFLRSGSYETLGVSEETYKDMYYEIVNSKIWRWTSFIRKFLDFFRR